MLISISDWKDCFIHTLEGNGSKSAHSRMRKEYLRKRERGQNLKCDHHTSKPDLSLYKKRSDLFLLGPQHHFNATEGVFH